MSDEKIPGLSHLGNQETEYKQTYDPSVLEVFDNKNPGSNQWVSFVCTEFTSLCPITSQPDFARIFINYIADDKMVESKALKLYLFSFRNHGDFHENCVETICQDLKKLMNPKFIEVIGEFTPRGGIAIYPYSSAHNSEDEYIQMSRNRKANYSPGSFTFAMGRPY